MAILSPRPWGDVDDPPPNPFRLRGSFRAIFASAGDLTARQQFVGIAQEAEKIRVVFHHVHGPWSDFHSGIARPQTLLLIHGQDEARSRNVMLRPLQRRLVDGSTQLMGPPLQLNGWQLLIHFRSSNDCRSQGIASNISTGGRNVIGCQAASSTAAAFRDAMLSFTTWDVKPSLTPRSFSTSSIAVSSS